MENMWTLCGQYDQYMDGGFLVNSYEPIQQLTPPELPGMVLAVSGIDPSDPSSLELAKAVAESSETSLAGLYTHGGHSYDQVQSLPTEMGRLKLCFVEWSDWKAVKCLLKDLEILSMQINMLFFGFLWLLVF